MRDDGIPSNKEIRRKIKAQGKSKGVVRAKTGKRVVLSWRVKKHRRKEEFARDMRLNPSPPEAMLWGHLQYNFSGVFCRQAVMCGYIADFYSPSLNLVIEIDGKQHEQPEAIEYDQTRDAAFARRGFKVVRFTAQAVFHEIDSVLTEISKLVSLPLRQKRPESHVMGAPSSAGRGIAETAASAGQGRTAANVVPPQEQAVEPASERTKDSREP